MILDTPWPDIIARGVLLAIAAIIWVVVLIRLNGLRSLSKMTNFDFVMTIALGSLVAGAAQASGRTDKLARCAQCRRCVGHHVWYYCYFPCPS